MTLHDHACAHHTELDYAGMTARGMPGQTGAGGRLQEYVCYRKAHLPAPLSVVLKVILAPVAPATPLQKALTYVHHMIWLLMPENHSG